MDGIKRTGRLLVIAGISILVIAAVVGSFLTRDTESPESVTAKAARGQPAPLVDESPLTTARAMATLAIGPDQQQVAEQISDSADNVVDLDFHDASRYAADHPAQAKPENRALYQHAAEAEEQVKTDQESVAGLKKQLAAAAVTQQDAIQEKLDVAQAQLELDQDELDDAKGDLMRAGADPGALIQHQFEQHQATEHTSDNKTAGNSSSTPAIDYEAKSLYSQFSNWRKLRNKVTDLNRARDETAEIASKLRFQHDALEKEINAAKGSALNVQTLHVLGDDNKILADYDQRIQGLHDIENGYGRWIGLVQRHQRAMVHSMIQSGLWIVLIILVVALVDHFVQEYLTGLSPERTRLHTLNAVIRFSLQALAVLLIAFVVFGAPKETPTVLGLAGAGLTVAMKDFIVGFFGWFVLMGRNGIRVGDWVEIDGVAGQVVEINLLRTVLLETGNWTDSGHPTGRKVSFVNSYAIEGHFFNFSTAGQWLWDEIQIVVPATQNLYPMIEAIQKMVNEETAQSAHAAEQEWSKSTNHYRVSAVSAAPAVNLRPTGSGVEVHVRYITKASERYATRTHLYQSLVTLLQAGSKPDASAQAVAK